MNKRKSPKSRGEFIESVFQEAQSKAEEIYRGFVTGRFSPYFHRVHIEPSGDVSTSVASQAGACSEAAYNRHSPYDLTLWEIDGQRADGSSEFAEHLGGEEHMGEQCRQAEHSRFHRLPVNPDHWTKEQRIAVYEFFLAEFNPISNNELFEKRAEFDDWAVKNLSLPKH